MGKTRDLFKKIRDTKGAFHARIGSIKDRNGLDLTEAEDIKKRWQEYTEELYKKDLQDQDNHDGVITHLEPDILECEGKWALESITTKTKLSADEWISKLWYIYTMEYYSAVKKKSFESVLMRWMKLEPIIQSEVSQKEKHQYSILTHIYGI